MRKLLLCAAVLMIAGVAARADDWNKTFTVNAKPEVFVNTDDGNVIVVTGGGTQVAAAVHTSGWRISADEIRVEAQQSGNRIELTVRKAPGMHLEFFGHRSIRIDLTVPTASDLNLTTKDGNIDATGVRGTHQLHSGDGNLRLRSLDGTLRAETGDGNIQLDGRFDVLDLHTGDGNVAAEIARGSKMTGMWTIRTGDGNIRLELPSDFSADIDAHTGDGHVHSNLPLTVSGNINENGLRGKLNAGGSVLELRTGDGDIRLEKAMGAI